MKFRVRHYTEYTYPDPASTCYNRLCLTPVDSAGHRCESSDISIVPRPDELTHRTDFFGNRLVFFSVFKEHDRLKVSSNSTVEIDRIDHAYLASRANRTWKDVLQRMASGTDIDHENLQ